jgi:diguanylate cyclase (GGDEF)-like protein
MALIGWHVARLSRRIERDIVYPLHRLASLTRTARSSRAFGLRAPAAAVAEIHDLGEDFNALIAEIQCREAEQEARHDKLRTANASLSFLAFHDSLTGLPNRARFLEGVEQALLRHAGDGGKVAVLYVDCDNFKSINDTLGHAAGDALLIEVAARIRQQLREDGLVARLGGDEFAVLLAPIGSVEFTLRIAQRIASAIREPLEHGAFGLVQASASVGVAVFPDHADDPQQLLAAADAAMYRAKALQGGQVVVAAPSSLDHLDPAVDADTARR